LKYAEITGWGKYAPPVIMTNDDIAQVIDTSDDWIYSRSGIRRRHISHVSTGVSVNPVYCLAMAQELWF